VRLTGGWKYRSVCEYNHYDSEIIHLSVSGLLWSADAPVAVGIVGDKKVVKSK